MATFRDDFDADHLDTDVWVPHYLPAWSSRADTRASYELTDSLLRLWIPPDAGLWLPTHHPDPLRVSVIQSGNHSGPVGSTSGQQPFDEPIPVQEAQPRVEGWLPTQGRVAVRCRMTVSHRSMGALWMEGFDGTDEHSGELCVVEAFGRDITGSSASINVGIKAKRDPDLTEDVRAVRRTMDLSAFHEYAVEWDSTVARFTIDGDVVHSSPNPPTYPLQVYIGLFDFPAWSTGDDDHLVPTMDVDWVEGTTPG